ncbi:MAG: DUF3576 domain-containing protein [Rhodospirillales bacterium]|nr:DUF3576 domain-containing protein [Rhodospirillales bacterium]
MPSCASTRRRFGVLAAVLMAGLLAACSGDDTVYPRDTGQKTGGQRNYDTSDNSVFGPSGLTIGGDDKKPEGGAGGGGGGGIGVNSFLWRASLDTISFMPLSSADPFGGVIITDWYTPPEVLRERFKVNVYILGRDLRADGLRATVFRQRQDLFGNWVDTEVDKQTPIDLEDAILTRARQLRIAAVQ